MIFLLLAYVGLVALLVWGIVITSYSIHYTKLYEGGLIDRGRPLDFVYDGRAYQGYAGDTLASALLANGVRVCGRSFKYHRPRGVYAAGVEEPNALVQLRTGARTEPNVRATQVELFS